MNNVVCTPSRISLLSVVLRFPSAIKSFYIRNLRKSLNAIAWRASANKFDHLKRKPMKIKVWTATTEALFSRPQISILLQRCHSPILAIRRVDSIKTNHFNGEEGRVYQIIWKYLRTYHRTGAILNPRMEDCLSKPTSRSKRGEEATKDVATNRCILRVPDLPRK